MIKHAMSFFFFFFRCRAIRAFTRVRRWFLWLRYCHISFRFERCHYWYWYFSASLAPRCWCLLMMAALRHDALLPFRCWCFFFATMLPRWCRFSLVIYILFRACALRRGLCRQRARVRAGRARRLLRGGSVKLLFSRAMPRCRLRLMVSAAAILRDMRAHSGSEVVRWYWYYYAMRFFSFSFIFSLFIFHFFLFSFFDAFSP